MHFCTDIVCKYNIGDIIVSSESNIDYSNPIEYTLVYNQLDTRAAVIDSLVNFRECAGTQYFVT